VEGPIERRLRTSQAHMRFPSLIMTLCSDTLFSHVRSVRGYTCGQVFTDGHGFVRVYSMKSKGDAHQIVKKYRIRQKTTEACSPWQNRDEAEIRELKKLTRRALRLNSTPSEFWCYAMEWAAHIRSYTAHDSMILGSRTPEELKGGAFLLPGRMDHHHMSL